LCSNTDENIYAIFADNVLIKVRLLGFYLRHPNTALQILRLLTFSRRHANEKKMEFHKTQCGSELRARQAALFSENREVSKLVFDQ